MTNSDVRKTLIVIVGPTGSGKTDLSIRVARHFGSPILSTDSRQVYRGMPIGTAQPTADQLATADHYMIANHEITEHFTCGQYEVEALSTLEKLFSEHDVVVAVGGSGLYIDALCNGMDDIPDGDPELRHRLTERAKAEGLEPLLEQLCELDPTYYDQVDKSNRQRVIRALEVCKTTGKTFSSFRAGTIKERPFRIIKIGTQMDRNVLYDRINRRVEMMLDEGLENEARGLYPFRELNSLQTVGYREFFDYFDGTISRDEAIELIKRNSRRYAKRQMTWFNRDSTISWFEPQKITEIISHIESQLAEEFCKFKK